MARKLPVPKVPKLLSRPPVGGLRFDVVELGPGYDYRAVAADVKGKPYEIRAHQGQLVLESPDGEVTTHASIDEAEVAAGRLNRKRHPLRVPKFRWRKHQWKEPRFDKGHNVREFQAAEACDVPFLGTGHFTAPAGRPTAHDIGVHRGTGLGWTGALGPTDHTAQDVSAMATACGIVDPYCHHRAGNSWNATKAQVADQYRVLIKAANDGRKLYRVFPAVAGQEQHLPGSMRQIAAWDAWYAAAQARKHWAEWKGRGDYRRKFPFPHGYEYVGQAIFQMKTVLTGISAGKVRYGPQEKHDKEYGGIYWAGARANEVASQATAPNAWRQLDYPTHFVDDTTHRDDELPQPSRITYVEIVQYTDGDKPTVKSMGYFRPLTKREDAIRWGYHPGVEMAVKRYPGTPLTRVELASELPEASAWEQMLLVTPEGY